MEAAFVEEVAASLVREFLSKKGLKKTSKVMDQEFPRTDLSINNRNELRNILHLQSLYKLNKANENPLKTILEIMTRYFLEDKNTKSIKSSPIPQNKVSWPRSLENSECKNSLSDEDICGQAMCEKNKTEIESYKTDEEIHRPAAFPRKNLKKSEMGLTGATLHSDSPTGGYAKQNNNSEDLKKPELNLEAKTTMREKPRARPGLIVRGMMAGPTASSLEDSLKRRPMKRPSGIISSAHHREEDGLKIFSSVPEDEFQDSKGRMSPPIAGGSCSTLDVRWDHSPKISLSPFSYTVDERARNPAESGGDSFVQSIPGRPRAEERKPVSGYKSERNDKSPNRNLFQRPVRAGSEERERSPRKTDRRCFGNSKTLTSISSGGGGLSKDALELVDVEDEATLEPPCRIPDPSTLRIIQVASRPIDLFLARDLKTLLFGSSLSCFSEEWKIQSFMFNSIPQLKYGIVQKKGGPCGVLAAVQACVLRHLIFGDRDRNSCDTWCSQVTEAHRTKCLVLALAGILWRAGGSKTATVALCSGTQQFTPAGKYKADGIMETLMLHVITNYEDLMKFLQQNISQFEAGPHGCILLTLSVILSRSIDQVRCDFDVITNRLIGAHGYCTQELVNLLLTGKAVSNVFNDLVELDSGNGNITVLKGITGRSEVGLLSLFEHYDICQVGCYLKTPVFPIWVVCSESHFSVLFCLRKDLLGDWRAERLFDLYYYDGLANQEEEIRLTVDTSLPFTEDRENDLISPLELCIRTKWKGALVDWNGTEPLL